MVFHLARAWRAAVREAWPDVVDETTGELVEAAPRLLPCLWHLSGVVRSWLRASNILPPRDEPTPVPVRRKQTGVNKHLRMSRAGRPQAYTRAPHDALQARAGRAAPQKVGITGGPRLRT